MADVLKRLYGPAQLATSATTLYTVPASTTTVIRNIHVANESATATAFNLSIGAGDSLGTRIFSQNSVPGNDSFDWTGNIVLAAGEVLSATAVTASVLTLIISGVESS